MALPTSRTEFKDYCLRRLGAGAIDINVTDAQIEDRIDDALAYYTDYHYDGSEHVYFKHVVTADDISNEYISVPENIFGLVELYDINNTFSSSLWHTAQYQLIANELNQLSSFSSTNVFFTNYQIEEIQNAINVIPLFRYNRHLNKLHIDTRWGTDLKEGDFILVRAYQALDHDVAIDVWKDIWLARYTTALIQRQWGANLTKFAAMLLPGGVTFDAVKLYDDAVAEILRLEEEMINAFSLPPIGLIG